MKHPDKVDNIVKEEIKKVLKNVEKHLRNLITFS